MPSDQLKITELETWMRTKEGENFEFKEAKNDCDFEKLVKYCCALANEGGGRIILGVSDKEPFQKPSCRLRRSGKYRYAASGKRVFEAAMRPEGLLADAEAVTDGQVTCAALILFGTSKALGRRLAQAEVVFEYRSSDASGPAQDRVDYRRGFFTFYDELWERISLRNDKQDYQSGLFVTPIATFNERPVREAILNAVPIPSCQGRIGRLETGRHERVPPYFEPCLPQFGSGQAPWETDLRVHRGEP